MARRAARRGRLERRGGSRHLVDARDGSSPAAGRPLRRLRPLAAVADVRIDRVPGRGARRAGRRLAARHSGVRAALLVAAPSALLQLDLLAAQPADRAGGDGPRLPNLHALRPLVSRRQAGASAPRSAGARRRASGRGSPAGRGRDGVPAHASHAAERRVHSRRSLSRPGVAAAGTAGPARATRPDHAPVAPPSKEAPRWRARFPLRRSGRARRHPQLLRLRPLSEAGDHQGRGAHRSRRRRRGGAGRRRGSGRPPGARRALPAPCARGARRHWPAAQVAAKDHRPDPQRSSVAASAGGDRAGARARRRLARPPGAHALWPLPARRSCQSPLGR